MAYFTSDKLEVRHVADFILSHKANNIVKSRQSKFVWQEKNRKTCKGVKQGYYQCWELLVG
ncbi:hypothetical protein PR048_010190 [Dryococelus australis]|uniref:Uncharacterized protein n=1 Tax=Dryococelus australis TaxID=614101 RepID=A0ABQ9I216_9NEOP|nr:hypothetical protein PR048_010190 [Dryococelus australis]